MVPNIESSTQKSTANNQSIINKAYFPSVPSTIHSRLNLSNLGLKAMVLGAVVLYAGPGMLQLLL